MFTTSPESVYPCPFSNRYGIPARQAWTLLKVFLIYRLVLATLFVGAVYHHVDSALPSDYYNELFVNSSQCYWVLTIVSVVCVFWRLTPYTLQAQLLIISDIVLLTLLMHACGGIKSGLGVLIAVSIAAGGLLIGGVCSVLFAAMGSLSVLAERIISDHMLGTDAASYTYAGMLGAAFFTIALLSYVLTKRSEDSFQLANQQQKTIVNLEGLNRYIIQNLQSGIVITDQSQQIVMVNQAAMKLVGLSKTPEMLADISSQLANAFRRWLDEMDYDNVSLSLPNQTALTGRFMALTLHYDSFYMVTLEDVALYNQRVQQAKLASLGRLTASIAHEIRNPLGAVSHAAQLLEESPDLLPQDLRFLDIIQTQCQRINVIVEDVLKVSKRNDSKRERFEVSSWLRQYLDNFSLLHQDHPNAFTLQCPDHAVSVFIDPSHLRQILNNLCENALKYGRPELGPITVRLRIVRGTPCIELIDNGAGIGSEHLDKLFEPFFTTSSSGTGLGLYISKELAELNQAKLSYYLTDGKKGCFRLQMLNADNNSIEI